MNPAVSDTSLQTVEKVFRWFNDLGARKIPLNRSDVERLFDPGLALMIDMKVMAKGPDGMVQRMTEMLAKTKWWSVTPLPFEFCLSEGDMAAAKRAVSWLWSRTITALLTAEKSSFVAATGIAAWDCGNNMKRNRLVR
jgi:hypothetical protein